MILNVNNQTIHGATGAVPLANRSEPLVVLVHGAGMDRTVWSHQTRFLAHHGFRALAVDLPGTAVLMVLPLPVLKTLPFGWLRWPNTLTNRFTS